MKKEFILEGLDCANCANKIETNILKIDGINNASVNFMTKTLTIETVSGQNEPTAVENVISAIKKLEPHIAVKAKDQTGQRQQADTGAGNRISRQLIVRTSVGVLLFAAGIIFNFSLWIEFSVFFAAYLLIGGEVVWKALKNISKGQIFDENFLMSIATVGAFAIKEFPEAVAVMLFYQIGEFFQDIAVNRSRRSITALMSIRPDFANLKTDTETVIVSPEEVNTGDIIVIKPGEKVPLDGRIISGESMTDTSALTGESLPREVVSGDMILSGTINLSGVLTVEVTKKFSESTVSKILDLVQNASSKKAPTENFITKFAKYYTPFVVFLALAIAVLPPLLMSGQWSEWVNRSLIFLVISCPCALVISIPLGFFGGIGGASKKGILVKGSNYLEALNQVHTIVFDKTGTLTKGVFKVTKINSGNGMTNEKLLQTAAYAEYFSNHPIASSIKAAYGQQVNEAQISGYTEISGQGVKVDIDGEAVLVGNTKLMKNNGVDFEDWDEAGTVIHVAVNHVYAGCIIISDEIKADSANAIRRLHEIGVKRTVMLTGDIRSVGEKVAGELGIDEVYSDLLPHQKLEKLESLYTSKAGKGKLVFIGDGINDAPVLARADVGVAMGGLGSDAAIEAADVVLMTDEPSKLITAIEIAKHTRKIVWQNIIFALAIKGIVLILGAGGIATMWEAVFADVGVSVLAILNAMRIMK